MTFVVAKAARNKRGLEGIVSKRVKAPYRSGRSGDWQKAKCKLRQEFVIGGYRHETTRSAESGFAPARLTRLTTPFRKPQNRVIRCEV